MANETPEKKVTVVNGTGGSKVVEKMDFDDKFTVTVCITIILIVAMYLLPDASAKEAVLLGIGGLLGFVTGRNGVPK